jgi:aminopeptidase N
LPSERQRSSVLVDLFPAAEELDRLEWIRQNRRIFFLPAWIDAFIGGQRDAAALDVVGRFLEAHPALPIDVRRKVLTARDELALTVRIRTAQF